MFVTGELESLICDAINIIVDKKIETANYDKMITAILTSDDLYGEKRSAIARSGTYTSTIYKEHCYQARYQNATFLVYPMHEEVTYSNGDTVLVLIPNNDMRNFKYIMRKKPEE
jgi:hypothetical protein